MEIKDCKVGMKVIGNKSATGRYGITKEGWTGEITDIGSNHICVGTFQVHPENFDPLEPIVRNEEVYQIF